MSELHVKRVMSVSTYCDLPVIEAGNSATPILAAASPDDVCRECLKDPGLQLRWAMLVRMVKEVLA